jgi:hypothetical protein
MTDTQTLKHALDKFLKRDQDAIEELNSWHYDFDNRRLNFVEGRLKDATALLVLLYKYILERENND